MNHHEKLRQRFCGFHDRGVLNIVCWTFMGIILAAFFALAFGLAVKALWNWIMPIIFGLGSITYWQAFGIVILSKILFSGIGPHHAHNWHGSPFIRQRRSYDRWWREEGQSAFDGWLQSQAEANPHESELQK